jgi:hypothetical protein
LNRLIETVSGQQLQKSYSIGKIPLINPGWQVTGPQRRMTMITYFYWLCVVLITGAALYGLGVKAEKWKAGFVVAFLLLLTGWSTYYFSLQQIFVKRYGGVMTITVPDGQFHLTATWKDDNLWVENFDPKTNSCVFNEYAKGSLLQGKVTIKNCNPLMNRSPASAGLTPQQ